MFWNVAGGIVWQELPALIEVGITADGGPLGSIKDDEAVRDLLRRE